MPNLNPYESPQAPSKYGPQPTRSASDHPYQSISTITRLVQLLFVVLAGTGLLMFITAAGGRSGLKESLELKQKLDGSRFYQGVQQDQLRLKRSVEAFQSLLTINAVLAYPTLLLSGVLGLAFLGWVYSASINLPALGFFEQRFRPVVAVLLLLIPLVNSIVSLFILSEIATGSDPERLTRYGHRSGGMSVLAVVWWIFAAASTAFTAVFFAVIFDRNGTPEALLHNLFWQSILSLSGVLPMIAGWYLVGTVFENQEKRRVLASGMSRKPDFGP